MLKTFPKGGIHPPEHKDLADKPIERLPLPKTAFIQISQHIGAPAEVVVKRKQKVKTGEVIASAKGFVSANIHSSVTGVVTKVDSVIDTSGYKKHSIFIRVSEDDWAEGIDTSDTLITEIKLGEEEIVKKILENGIVGLGGAAFPSHVKLSPPKDKKINVLIVNGIECEPYLTADHHLMLEKGEEVMVGIEILKKSLGVKEVIIGIENNKKDAIKHLSKLAKNHKNVRVEALKVKYPQGGEKQLIRAITGREVPSGGLPMDVGAVVHNVGTVFSIYEAVQKNKPLIERVVTVTGRFLEKPGNYWTRIGTPVADLIATAGGLPENTGKIINGGPMMGKALSDTSVPVMKGTSGILVFPDVEAKRGKVKNCIRCSRCITVCPMGLEPYLLMNLTQKAMADRAKEEDILDCIECGSCSYVCPSNRPLLDFIRLGKKIVPRDN